MTEQVTNLGLLHGCGYTWRLSYDMLMGVHTYSVTFSRWMRECATASRILGIPVTDHQAMGTAVYVAAPLKLPYPLSVIAEQIILWLCKATHDSNTGLLIASLHNKGMAATSLQLERANVGTLALQRAAAALRDGHQETSFKELQDSETEDLWSQWWDDRMQALVQVARLGAYLAGSSKM